MPRHEKKAKEVAQASICVQTNICYTYVLSNVVRFRAFANVEFAVVPMWLAET